VFKQGKKLRICDTLNKKGQEIAPQPFDFPHAILTRF
jgi:hypothetical protein